MASTQLLESLQIFYKNPYARSMYMTTAGYFSALAYTANYELPVAPMTLKFEKVIALPDVLSPGTMYMVKDSVVPDRAGIVFTNAHGSGTRRLLMADDVQQLLDQTFNDILNINIVETINERDLISHEKVALALVKDATLDTTVAIGSALYIFDPATVEWIKVSDYQSMDVVLNWTDINGKTSSNATLIDEAVYKIHNHLNIAILNKISDATFENLVIANLSKQTLVVTSEW